MNQEPIFFAPVFQERIWGGDKLRTLFGYDIPSTHTGEAWVISAHENGPSVIVNGEFAGQTLADVWTNHPDVFGRESTDDAFPLLVKVLDANDNLSVQVHPDDTYAQQVEHQPYGKTECWYVLDCDDDAEIVFGHHASSKEEFKQMVEDGEWDQLLRRVKVKKGDFIYVPSGTIHAIGKGIVILEIQQSSDITYRVYDYGRQDAHGQERELHIDSSIAVTTYPHKAEQQEKVRHDIGDLTETRLVQAEYFTVYHWVLNGKVETPVDADFVLVSVIEGAGSLTIAGQTYALTEGQHFLLPASVESYELKGNMSLIAAHE
ncbi:mannose-6-phosphate isomerase, class I [Lentibacillus saliphilus]|uniref:mannose-6-phosphate isomerase, class I n=1 Tax=Lentibacillus saliphilus TaxID=2737028 RepID=UPI001C2FC72B|nr:mannose-6-phosphate isomerase, class I [Lentibacillus saliphilus]